MFFKELSFKEKNMVTMIGSGIFFVANIALYLNLYLRRQQVFLEYGTTNVIEIMDKIPIFEPVPYELTKACVSSMNVSFILAILSLSIFIFSLVELSKSKKMKNK